jgi:hypothetical protein
MTTKRPTKGIKESCKEMQLEEASKLVREWKKQDIYPYEGKPGNLVEQIERQIFDLCALNFCEYLPEFNSADTKNKKITFLLLKNAIETNPELLGTTITNLLELPEEKQQELRTLLERTTLEAIITASKTVANRLNFINGLEKLVFDSPSREELRERGQLHRMIANETWIFGEEYHLTNDDQSLTTVLKKHLTRLGVGVELYEPKIIVPLKRADGREGIVDIVLGRSIPLPNANQHENLVIELKRPKESINKNAFLQITSYADVVARDERFHSVDIKWTFIAISNQITDDVKRWAKQKYKPPGLVYDSSDYNVEVWVKTWSQVINECKARLKFFQEKLNYEVDGDSAFAYLRKTYAKYLPGCLDGKES